MTLKLVYSAQAVVPPPVPDPDAERKWHIAALLGCAEAKAGLAQRWGLYFVAAVGRKDWQEALQCLRAALREAEEGEAKHYGAVCLLAPLRDSEDGQRLSALAADIHQRLRDVYRLQVVAEQRGHLRLL